MEDLAEFCVEFAQEQGADYAEARIEHVESNSMIMSDGVLRAAGFGSKKGIGIRVLKNKCMGFVSTNNLDKENLKKIILECIKSSNFGRNVAVSFSNEKTVKKKYCVKEKIKLADVGPVEKIKLLEDIEKYVEKRNEKINRYLSYYDSVKNKIIVNSEGTTLASKIPLVEFFYILTAHYQNKSIQRMWQLGNSGGFEQVKKWKVEEHINSEITKLMNNLINGIKCPSGKLDFVVSPEISGIMAHESGGHPYEADRILGREAAQAGESFITIDMKGTKIGSDFVSIIDDPTIPNSYGFFLYDDEGVKAQKKYLMKKGKINSFMHNRETAALCNEKSNGCSRASDYNREPLVRMSNTYIEPGKYKEEELIEDVKNGIYMKSFMEWNIDDKRWNQKYVGAESYIIKKGKITSPVINPVLEITTPRLYSSIDAVGKDLEFHPGSCGKGEPMQGMPVWLGGASLRIRNVRVR